MKLLLILTSVLLLTACQSEDVYNLPVIKNKYPIEYIGKKYFEYNKPYYFQYDSTTRSGDTLPIYSIANKTNDTVWVVTEPNDDRLWLKDSSIKIICESNISEHRIDLKDWIGFSDDAKSWGECDDSVKLYPNKATYFSKGRSNVDSLQYNITIKLKRLHKIKDSIISKKLILNKGHFVEDTSDWSKVFERFKPKKK